MRVKVLLFLIFSFGGMLQAAGVFSKSLRGAMRLCQRIGNVGTPFISSRQLHTRLPEAPDLITPLCIVNSNYLKLLREIRKNLQEDLSKRMEELLAEGNGTFKNDPKFREIREDLGEISHEIDRCNISEAE